MRIELRRLTAGDATLLENVAEDVFDEPVEPQRARAYLGTEGHLMLVALEQGVVVGQCAAVLHRHPDKADELYIDEVGVATSHLRRGIATRLVRAMFDWGRELGCAEAWLGTELDNDPANGLYRKLAGNADTMKYYEFKLQAP